MGPDDNDRSAGEPSRRGDGFRRAGPPPDPARSSLLRARLADAAHGQSRAVQDGLATFRSWENAAALAATIFPPAALRGAEASRRVLRRSLRILGARPAAIGDVFDSARGTPSRVTGRVLESRWKQFSHIWMKSEMWDHNVRLLVEEGHDFFLSDGTGPALLVLAAGGYLLGGCGDTIDAGDLIEVFGFVDRVIDGSSPNVARNLREAPLAPALRAGDDLPIIVRKIRHA